MMRLKFSLSRKMLLIAAGSVVLLSGSAAGAYFLLGSEEEHVLPKAFAGDRGPIGGAFSLIDQTGAPVLDTDLHDKPMVIFFSCSKVCELGRAGLETLSAVAEKMTRDGTPATPVFISIDPARDTPDVLKAFAAATPNVRALTGPEDAVAAVTAAYRVYHAVPEDAATKPDAPILQTSLFYLVGMDGKLLAHAPWSTDADALAHRFEAVLKAEAARIAAEEKAKTESAAKKPAAH